MRKLIIRKLGGVPKAEMDLVSGAASVQLKGAHEKIEELEAENANLRRQVEQKTSDKVIALQAEIARLRSNQRRYCVRNKAKGWRK